MSQNVNILFVEDSEDDAVLMIHCLDGICADLEYHRVESKQELLEVLIEKKWDLIIADNSLPQFTGKDAIELIRGKGINTPIICVSGTDIGSKKQKYLDAGAHAFILKNNFEKLKETAESIINDLFK